jgi:SPX domain protein involved in polyphosphate accumulation
MEQTNDFPAGRFEHKYLVTDEVAVAVRNAIRPHLAVDSHTPAESVRGYAVYSLYFDTPALDFYRHTREGLARRMKLRVRFYDHEADGVAFVEVKEKIDGKVFKRRYRTDKPFVESMLRDPQCESLQCALSNGARGTALEEFCQRSKELGAVPKLFIAYEREAFNSSTDRSVRVTFDRRIRTNGSGRDVKLAVPRYGANVGGLNVLIEFKYAGDPPAWLAEVEQHFLLRRASFSKFAECVDALQIFGPQPLPRRAKKKDKQPAKKTGNSP